MTFKLPRLDPKQRELLRCIADNADYLATTTDGRIGELHWLLVPLPTWMLEGLAEFESDLGDLDEHDGREPEQDGQSLFDRPESWGPNFTGTPGGKIPTRIIRGKGPVRIVAHSSLKDWQPIRRGRRRQADADRPARRLPVRRAAE